MKILYWADTGDDPGIIVDIVGDDGEFEVHPNLKWISKPDDTVVQNGDRILEDDDYKIYREEYEYNKSPKGLRVAMEIGRESKYGSIQAQLDMMYWDQINGTTEWKDKITAVKNEVPKVNDPDPPVEGL